MRPAPARKYVTAPDAVPGLVIAGYDPGITSPAVTIVQRKPGGGFGCLFHKVIRTSSALPDVERYFQIYDEVSNAIRLHHPTLVVGEEQRTTQFGKFERNEDSYQASGGKTLITVGIGMSAARAYRCGYIEVRTQSARVRVMGKGTKSASKNQVQDFIEAVLGVKLPQDAAEAGLNALYGFTLSPAERRAA